MGDTRVQYRIQEYGEYQGSIHDTGVVEDTRVQYRILEYGGYQGLIQDKGVGGIPGFNTGYRSSGDTRIQYRIQE